MSRFADFKAQPPACSLQEDKVTSSQDTKVDSFPAHRDEGSGAGSELRTVSQSGSCSLPQSRSGCAGLAGVNISLKNTTAYLSQVRLRRQLVEQSWGSCWGWCLFARCRLLWVKRPRCENHQKSAAELSFPLSYPRNLMSNSSGDPSNTSGLFNNHHTISTDSFNYFNSLHIYLSGFPCASVTASR